MTAPTRSTVTIFAAAAIAAGGTKAAPAAGGTGGWVDVRTLNGGQLAWSVKNGSSAPTVQGQFTFQVSDDGANNITDLWTGGGDTVASSEQTGLIDLPATASYVRMLCYGNTTNAVTFRGVLFAKG
ncbi:hypothetical protein [Massilia aerilata]|uniref:F5/8 type C domain-containing protein n=1 Tax=Massilia aerilata TaxID=453817 RepID=A0ABW0RTN2_9BURK